MTHPINIPSIEEIILQNPTWLLEAVDTAEAARLLGMAESTLISWRSRSGNNTPVFTNPKGTRIVRYLRVEIFRWLFSGGLKKNTADLGRTINLPAPANDNYEGDV